MNAKAVVIKAMKQPQKRAMFGLSAVDCVMGSWLSGGGF
jgi:hypothetical protein